jgi:Methyltransferase domain
MAEREGLELSSVVKQLAGARTMAELPTVVDLSVATPANPPAKIQRQFVGQSYAPAYTEAASFLTVADEWLGKHRGSSLSASGRVLDFGAGWGRIVRMLLTQMPATSIYALDVDAQMTSLVNMTLPGVNAITVDPKPPTVLADRCVDLVTAYSVFSHLAPAVHDAWAHELGRIIAPGGMIFMTVLDQNFLTSLATVREQVAAGADDEFSLNLDALFDDLDAAIADFDAGQPVYAGVGGGGVRSGDYYGWTALPIDYVTRVWGEAGFRVVEWVPANVLFPQAMVGLLRVDPPTKQNRFAATVRHRIRKSLRRQ